MTRTAALLPLVAVLLAGCAAAGPGGGSGDSTGSDPLAGRALVATADSTVPLADPGRVRLTFGADGRIGGTLGCNSIGGAYRIEAGVLRIDQGLVMTEMACEPDLMDQESRLARLLSAGPALTTAGREVRLRSADKQALVLVDDADAVDRPLAGTRWVLDGIEAGDTVSSVPAGVRADLRLQGGRLFVRTGCNTGSAPATVDGDRLVVGPLALTRKACGPAATDVERAIVAVLDGEVRVAVSGPTLRLTRSGHGLTYRASVAGDAR